VICLRVSITALALGLAVLTPAWSLDMLQAYEAALSQDPTVRAARAAADAGRERLPQARAQLLPSLSYSALRNRNDLDRRQPNALGLPTSVQERYNSNNETLTLRQPLFRPALHANYQQAGYLVEDTNAVLERELKNLGMRVSASYMEVLLAMDQLELVRAQITFTTAQLDMARKTFAAGSGTRTDIDEAQSRLDLARAQELEALQQLDFSRRQLQMLISQPVSKLAPLDVKRMPLQNPVPALVEDWTLTAEEKSPEMQSLKARLEAARAEVKKAQSGHYPTVDAVAQLINSSSENPNTPSTGYTNKTIGLQIVVPIYAGGYVNSTVRQALANEEQAKQELEALRLDLGIRVHKEFRGVTEGVLRVKALEQAVRSAEQLLLSTRKSFEAGSRTLTDILNAEQQKQVALRDLAQARYQYLNARIRLQALAGGDTQLSISETNAWLVN